MRRLLFAIGLLGLFACKTVPDYKMERQRVIDFHEKVMQQAWYAKKDQKLLDSLLRVGNGTQKKGHKNMLTTRDQLTADSLQTELLRLEKWMNIWMRDFNTDMSGKSEEQAIHYFRAQNKELHRMDSAYSRVLKRADLFLKDLGVQEQKLKR